MDILSKARALESKIARTIDDAAQRLTKSGPREPLEVVHAVVDAVGREVQAAGRGTHVFPFNKLKISVVAASSGSRARLEAVFEGTPRLHDRIVDRLQAAGCEALGLTVRTTYVPHGESTWTDPDFHIEFARVSQTAPAAPMAEAAPPRIDLRIVEGSAEKAAYTFAIRRIDLGRCAEVRDRRNRLIRTNHVAFCDAAGDLNQSVSRRHAHIDYDGAAVYRAYDDRSAHGTAILRDGRTIPVPPGSRGVRLRSGDEIALGGARLRITIRD